MSEGAALRFGTVTKLGEGEVVAGTVMMLIGSNSREVVKNVKQRLAEIQKRLPEDVQIRSYYDRAEFIDRTLHTVFMNLAEGATLVVMLLFFTLGSFRAALIASLAIPFSMGLTVLAMIQTHVTGNSLGAIDFGLLVDGAIVMLEVALVALGKGEQDSPRDAVAKAVGRSMAPAVRPVLFSLLIIMLVYLPLMALEGSEGRMFKPMAVTIAYALASALLFSLTAVPALAAYGLIPFHHAQPPWERTLRHRYQTILGTVVARPRNTFIIFAVLLLATGVLAPHLSAEFVPRLDEGELSLDVRRPPSISLTTAERLGTEVEKALEGLPEVVQIVTRTGRAEVATDPAGPDESAVRVKLRPKEEWVSAHDLDALGDFIKKRIESRVPATFVAVSQPIEDTVNTLVAGSRADVAIKPFGSDLRVLKGTGDAIAKLLTDVPGAGDCRVQRVLGLPLLNIKPDRARLARYGANVNEVLDVVQASRLGQTVGRVFEGRRRFDLTVLVPPPPPTVQGFGDLWVGTPSGQLLPLEEVAIIEKAEGHAVINREDFERRVMVEINVRGRDLLSFVNDAKSRVEQHLKLPEGVRVVWGGQFENFNRAKDRLMGVVPVALALIFAMLFLMFGDVRPALAVFATVSCALVGGVLLLWLRHLPFSIPAAVGFIAVGGVSVLNGVVMASRHLALCANLDAPEAARQGADWR